MDCNDAADRHLAVPQERGQSILEHAREEIEVRFNFQEVNNMLRWALIFLVIALVAALFGFTGIASAAAGIAKFLFFLFLVICLVLFILGISVARKL
jgi:uncharacterized membrane protein YtjA (UPF0391 family)